MQEQIVKRALELLADGTVNRVLGWKTGEFAYDTTPAVFTSAEEVEKELIYNDFCGANLSKYLIKESRKEGKILALLKPCDTYSFNQLCKEHRIIRENVYVIGIECTGKVSAEKIKAAALRVSPVWNRTARMLPCTLCMGTLLLKRTTPRAESAVRAKR